MGSAFDFVAEAIEAETDLARLEARGTLRLALKEAGLAANTVRASELAVVLDRVMPRELQTRGVGAPEEVCQRIRRSLDDFDDTAECAQKASPETIFARLSKR